MREADPRLPGARSRHVLLNFAILTTPNGEQEVIEYVVNAVNSWSSDGGGVDYPTCMEFTVEPAGSSDWMVWSGGPGGSWIKTTGAASCRVKGSQMINTLT